VQTDFTFEAGGETFFRPEPGEHGSSLDHQAGPLATVMAASCLLRQREGNISVLLFVGFLSPHSEAPA
jgi:hypothetical protein